MPFSEDFLKDRLPAPQELSPSFIKFCEALSSSVELKDFLLNLKLQIPKKFKTGELLFFYESEQLGLRRAYVKNFIFYEHSAQQFWPVIQNIRLSSIEENLYLAREFGRPFFKVLMIPIKSSPKKALLALEINNSRFLSSLIDFFRERKAILELTYKKAHLNLHFKRISYLWSQLFSYWWEPLAVLDDYQVLLGNDSFKKSLSLSKKTIKEKKNSGVLEQEKKTYQLHYYPLRNSLGVLYCQDMTKYSHLKAQLFQSEKMSKLSDISQNMAHQLNNPLTGVKSMTQVLRARPALKKFKEEFAELEKAIQRSQKIIESFLSFSNQGNQPTICNINQILEDTLLLLKGAVRGIRLEVGFYRRSLEVKGDFALLQQAFYNLILNACQALGENKENKDPVIQINTYPISEDEFCLKIKDNGIGIKQENLKKIFQPFWTSKEKGTGFGLGVTEKIVQQCGGKIFVSSRENQFTCFTVIFPLYPPELSLPLETEKNINP